MMVVLTYRKGVVVVVVVDEALETKKDAVK